MIIFLRKACVKPTIKMRILLNPVLLELLKIILHILLPGIINELFPPHTSTYYEQFPTSSELED